MKTTVTWQAVNQQATVPAVIPLATAVASATALKALVAVAAVGLVV